MEKLQNLLLLLTEDLISMDEMIKTHLGSIDSIDVLVDVDILRDYKSKLIGDIIELNHQSQKETLNFSVIKRNLHNLMCFYSEYVDRCISLVRTFSRDHESAILTKVNMTGINALLFTVLQDVRKQEVLNQVQGGLNGSSQLESNKGYDIDGVVLV